MNNASASTVSATIAEAPEIVEFWANVRKNIEHGVETKAVRH